MADADAQVFRIAADVGGTFTDVAVFNERTGACALGKTLSTPDNLVAGIMNAASEAGANWPKAALFLHGSTVAINAMLERTGARVALITTEGFRDIYEIGRINRPDSFNLFFRKHRPLVERALRFEAPERMMADGVVHRPLRLEALTAIAEALATEKVEAIAILFLHSYRNPAHEQGAKKFFSDRFPDLFITASHEICQEYREYERTSTVVANAYVGPRVRRYLRQIEATLREKAFSGRFMVVQSTGGLFSSEDAQTHCVRIMESGPAAGVVGTQVLCGQLGLADAISFDMGGTTAKSGVVLNGRALTIGQAMIGGYNEGLPLLTEMVDICEVGTGGGSIARVSPSGAIRVGPQSAGAEPGPACYARGGLEPTVTDANLVLGRLSPARFLGGQMKLDVAAAEAAISAMIARPLAMDPYEAALGVLRIAVTNMSHAVRGVTTERGLDLGRFGALVAFGGAGPLHASMVARELRIAFVAIPKAPGHFSACGMLLSDARYDFSRSVFLRLSDLDFDELNRQFEALEAEGAETVRRGVGAPRQVICSRALDMRYVGQEHAVTVETPLDLFQRRDRQGVKKAFDQLHAERYGRQAPAEEAEIVSLRATVFGILPKFSASRIERGKLEPPARAKDESRDVYFSGSGWVKCPIYKRDALLGGNEIDGPALIEEHASTTVLLAGDRLRVDEIGNLIIAIGRDAA